MTWSTTPGRRRGAPAAGLVARRTGAPVRRQAQPSRHAGVAAPPDGLRPAGGRAGRGAGRHGDGPHAVTLSRRDRPHALLPLRGRRGRRDERAHLRLHRCPHARVRRKLGQSLQLVNILRDVGEDARRGRIYLPVNTLQRFEVPASEVPQGRLLGALHRADAVPRRPCPRAVPRSARAAAARRPPPRPARRPGDGGDLPHAAR